MQRLVAQIGLSGNRSVDLSFWPPWFRILDVALEFHKLLSPEFDDMDVKFVYEDRFLEMDLTVEEAGLTNGAEIRAIMDTSWKIKLRASMPSLAYPLSGKCACVHCNRRVMGWHFNVNVNAFRPAFIRGGKTRFSDVIACVYQHVDWDLEHNEGRMPADQVLMLARSCQREWLWNCCVCNKMRLCASEHCTPIDMMMTVKPADLLKNPCWIKASYDGIVCSSCAWEVRRLAECMTHDRRMPLANIDTEMLDSLHVSQPMRQRPT
jgi:hypothetical protein